MRFLSKLFGKKQPEIAPNSSKQAQSKGAEVYSVTLTGINDRITAIKGLKSSLTIPVMEAKNIADNLPLLLIETTNKYEVIRLRVKLKTCTLNIEEDGKNLTEREISTLFPTQDWVEPPNIKQLQREHNVKELIKALKYKQDTKIQGEALDALGEIGDTSAVKPLIPFLNNKENGNLRWGVVSALGEIGDTSAVKPLITILKNNKEKDDLRGKAAFALGIIGDTSAVKPLIAILNNKEKNYDLRGEAALALGKIGDTSAVQPLIAFIPTLKARVYGSNNLIYSDYRCIRKDER